MKQSEKPLSLEMSRDLRNDGHKLKPSASLPPHKHESNFVPSSNLVTMQSLNNMQTMRKQQSAPKRVSFRQSLRSPYSVQWPTIEEGQSERVISIIKIFVKNFMKSLSATSNNATNKESAESTAISTSAQQSSILSELAEGRSDVLAAAMAMPDPYLYIGLNSVTKALENRKLCVTVVSVPVRMHALLSCACNSS